MPWKKLYESCVSETNPDRLKRLVFQLEDAIVLRYHDLVREPNDSGEHQEADELQALRRVAQQLRQLKMERLGWLQPAVAAGPAMPALAGASVPAPAVTVEGILERAPRPSARRKVASRIQSALLTTQRAWQNWVFKSLK